MKRPLIYDLATQWHANRFPLMACYYHLPYRANNSSWETPHLRPGKALAAGSAGSPALLCGWGGQGDAGPPSHGLGGEAAAAPVLGPGDPLEEEMSQQQTLTLSLPVGFLIQSLLLQRQREK